MTESTAGATTQVGTKLLFENDRVKVWEMDLAPGEETALHRHDHDYLMVILEGDRIAGVPAPGADPAVDRYIEADIVPGLCVFRSSGHTEIARNIGVRRYYEIIVELKDPAPADA